MINLNSSTAPRWADDLAEGPLFAGQRTPAVPDRRYALAEALLEALRYSPLVRGRVRIDWHLGEPDFAKEAEGRLQRLARQAGEELALTIVFDRPRLPVALAEGIDRRHPAVLLGVGLHLPRLADMVPSGEGDKFLQKLGSLARLALSAAVQKREFLRRYGHDRPALARGFLLERARLMVVPVGLEAAVRLLTGRGLCDGKALELARQVVQRLSDVLHQDGRASLLEVCLDGPSDFVLAAGENQGLPKTVHANQVAGLTAWDRGAAVKVQLRTAGALHTVAEGGTAAVLLEDGRLPAPEEQVAEWLRGAWQQTGVVRLRFVPLAPLQGQLPLEGEGTTDRES